MSSKVFPIEVIYVIYEFERNAAIFSWPMWRHVCKMGQINAHVILAEYMEALNGEVNEDYCVLLAWIKCRGLNNELCGFLCLWMGKLLRQNGGGQSIKVINLTLILLAALDASCGMHIMVRKKISEWLFSGDIHDVVFELWKNDGTENKAWWPFDSIQYYGPYDSPELVKLQLKGFPVTEYVKFNGRQSNVPDLSKCAFPIRASPEQIEAYVHLITPHEDAYEDKRVINGRDNAVNLFNSANYEDRTCGFLRALYCGNTFVSYSSQYRQAANNKRSRRIVMHSLWSNKVNLYEDLYEGDNFINGNTLCTYLIVSLLCGKRRREFLNASGEQFDKLVRMRYGAINIVGDVIIPYQHKNKAGARILNNDLNRNCKKHFKYEEMVSCPLFVDYIELYWQHRDIILGANSVELPHRFDRSFAVDAVAKSMAFDEELTKKVMLCAFNDVL